LFSKSSRAVCRSPRSTASAMRLAVSRVMVVGIVPSQFVRVRACNSLGCVR
jgi:hypothetical protein